MVALAEQDRIDALDSGAIFSPCRRWRYLLWRRWDVDAPVVAFIGLNPSTADETFDDQTIRRCMNFAKLWGYGAMQMVNLFAFTATDPAVMKAAGSKAVGPRNDEYLLTVARRAQMVVAAWGVQGGHRGRADYVRRMLDDDGLRLHILRLSKSGRHPWHPLYLPASSRPVVWPLFRGD